jgi:hypothetical protein
MLRGSFWLLVLLSVVSVTGYSQLKVTSEGFEPTTIEVTVGAQPPAPLQISLAVRSLYLEPTVTSETSQINTEADENKDSVALSEQSLSNLPVFDIARRLSSVAAQASSTTVPARGPSRTFCSLTAHGLDCMCSRTQAILTPLAQAHH